VTISVRFMTDETGTVEEHGVDGGRRREVVHHMAAQIMLHGLGVP